MKNIRKIMVILLVVPFLLLPSCNKKEKVNENIVNIGVLVPLNGPQTQAGTEVLSLLSLIEDTINKPSTINLPFHESIGLPNLNGAKVHFVIGDSSTPDIAMSEAERLITEENVIGLTGLLSSSSTKTIMVPAERYGVPLLAEGTSESLTKEGYEFLGRTFPGDDTFIKDTFSYISNISATSEKKIKKIALVSEDSEFGANIAETERKWAKKYGFEIIEDISYSAQASNVTSEVLRIKKAQPDAVIMSSYIADALLFMSTFKEQNYFPPMLFGQRGGFASSDFVQNLKQDADFVFSTARWNADLDRQVSQDLAALFKEEYSGGVTLIGDVMAVGWNAYLLAIAANQAESRDPVKIREAMAEGLIVDSAQDPSGLSGYIYGPTGQNECASAIVVQVQDQKMVTVSPVDVAKTKAIYPAENWHQRSK